MAMQIPGRVLLVFVAPFLLVGAFVVLFVVRFVSVGVVRRGKRRETWNPRLFTFIQCNVIPPL